MAPEGADRLSSGWAMDEGRDRPALRWGSALVTVALAAGVRLLIDPWLGDQMPYPTFIIAVAVTSWYAGIGPALLVLTLSSLVVPWLFLAPRGLLAIGAVEQRVGLGLFLAVSATLVGMIESLKRAYQTADEVAVDAARRREALQMTLSSIGDAVIVTDEDGRATFLNPVAESLTGWSSEEARGMPLADVFRIVNDTTRQTVENPAARALRDGTVVGLANHTLLISRNGIEHPIDDSAAPIRDERGTVTGVVLVFRDITERKKFEEALREGQHRLRLALESGRMGIWEWDIGAGTVAWSPALEAIHGLQPGEFGGTFDDYQRDMHPEDRERVLASVREALEGKEHHLEYRIVWPDGSIHWIEARGRLFRDADGHPLRMIGVCTDITVRKQIEEERQSRIRQLAEAEQRVRSVVDTVVDGILTIDDRGIVQTINRAAERIFGYGAEEIIGRNVKLLMPQPYQSEHDGYVSRYLQTGEARIIGIGREVVGRRKDGSPFPMDLGVSEFRNGAQRYFTGIVRDITERKRSENVVRFLADASRVLATLVDYESTLQKVAHLAVPFFADWCAVLIQTEDGSLRQLAVTHVDPAKVQRAEELGRRYPQDPDANIGAARVLRTGESEMVSDIPDELLQAAARDEDHLRILRELGLKSYISVPLAVRGRVLGVISFVAAESGRRYTEADLRVAEDLAHRAAVAIENARLYSELREADRRKDEFLAMLAHELRNPLAPIRSGLDLLAVSGVTHEAIPLMQDQVEHLVRLVDDLLDVSRIMRGKVKLHLESVDLRDIAERAAEAARPMIESQDHELKLTLPSEPVWVEADRVRLGQVITNLLNNAAKYTEPGGRIGVTVAAESGQAVLQVCDTGIGIDPELLPRIFDLFTQADRSLERSQGGLGIGLTLVRTLVDLHGGTVSARSEGAGKGSEFTIQLPITDPASVTTDEPRVPVPRVSCRILVVDDNAGAARMLALLLSQMGGHEIQTAHDGPSALEVARAFNPDLILLDIGLPRMSGYDVARILRSEPAFNSTLLVALTGYGTEDDRRRSLECGFDVHLVKPPSVTMIKDLFSHPRLAACSSADAPASGE